MKNTKRFFVMAALAATFSSTLSVNAAAADQMPLSAGAQKSSSQKISPETMREHMAKRQSMLHDQLKLTPAQEPAWKTYLAAMVPPSMSKAEQDTTALEKMSAPDRMEKMLEMTKIREALMTSHLAALKTFYAVLTPSQQQIFDQQTRPGRHRMQHPPTAGDGPTKG